MSKILGAITAAGTALTAGGAVTTFAEVSGTENDSLNSVHHAEVNDAEEIEMTDDELALAIEEYNELYAKYYTMIEEILSEIPVITEEVNIYDGVEYAYIVNYNIDDIDFSVLYNNLGNTPTYGVGNLEGIVLINDGVNAEVALNMTGALVQDYFDGDKLHIKGSDELGNYFEVNYRIDDYGTKFEYEYLVNDLESSLSIRTTNLENGSESYIKLVEGEYTNSYKYKTTVTDDVENVKVEYNIDGVTRTVKVTVTEDLTDYEFYEGITNGHKKNNGGEHNGEGKSGHHHHH